MINVCMIKLNSKIVKIFRDLLVLKGFTIISILGIFLLAISCGRCEKPPKSGKSFLLFSGGKYGYFDDKERTIVVKPLINPVKEKQSLYPTQDLSYHIIIDHGKYIKNPLEEADKLYEKNGKYIEIECLSQSVSIGSGRMDLNTDQVASSPEFTKINIDIFASPDGLAPNEEWEPNGPIVRWMDEYTINTFGRTILTLVCDAVLYNTPNDETYEEPQIDETLSNVLKHGNVVSNMLFPIPLKKGYHIAYLYFNQDLAGGFGHLFKHAIAIVEVVGERNLFDHKIDCYILEGNIIEQSNLELKEGSIVPAIALGKRVTIYVEKTTGKIIKEIVEDKTNQLIKTIITKSRYVESK